MPEPASSAALSQTEKTPVTVGVVLKTPEEIWRLATIFAASDLVPKEFRNKKEDIFVAIEYGSELGFKPFQALQSICVINGRPTVWGDGLLALVKGSGLCVDHNEYFVVNSQPVDAVTGDDLKKESTTAICSFLRLNAERPVTRQFSIAQAQRAGLLTKQGPWTQYPDRMLRMRARSWAARDCFPDLLRGIMSAEEALDIAPSEPPAVRRRSQNIAPLKPAALSHVCEIVETEGLKAIDEMTGDLTLSDDTIVVAPLVDVDALKRYVGTSHPLRLTTRREAHDLHRHLDGYESLD